MRMCSPHNQTLVGGRPSEFVEGWKPITNNPNVLSIVTKGYRLRFTSPPILRKDPVGDMVPPGSRGNSGHAGTNIPNAPEESDNEVPPDSPGFYSW